MKKYSRGHIGETHTIHGGYKATVIDGGSKPSYCLIQIGDWVKEVVYQHLRKGIVRYPYSPSVHGKGYLGIGSAKVRVNGELTTAYTTWRGLLHRVYYQKALLRSPTYIDVTVCKEWHNFQAYNSWFLKHYIEGYTLDKDLLAGEGKQYSPSTCIFIPVGLNSFLTNVQKTNTSGFVGVSWHKRIKKWGATISGGTKGVQTHLGYFNTPEGASEAYKQARAKQADIWKERMHGILPSDVLRRIK